MIALSVKGLIILFRYAHILSKFFASYLGFFWHCMISLKIKPLFLFLFSRLRPLHLRCWISKAKWCQKHKYFIHIYIVFSLHDFNKNVFLLCCDRYVVSKWCYIWYDILFKRFQKMILVKRYSFLLPKFLSAFSE